MPEVYRCDPEKNKGCNKSGRQTYCFHTFHKEYAVPENAITLDEFFKQLEDKPLQDWIVRIRIKTDSDTEYHYSNELLLLATSGSYEWYDDWYEGEKDIMVVGYKAVSEVKVDEVTIWINA